MPKPIYVVDLTEEDDEEPINHRRKIKPTTPQKKREHSGLPTPTITNDSTNFPMSRKRDRPASISPLTNKRFKQGLGSTAGSPTDTDFKSPKSLEKVMRELSTHTLSDKEDDDLPPVSSFLDKLKASGSNKSERVEDCENGVTGSGAILNAGTFNWKSWTGVDYLILASDLQDVLAVTGFAAKFAEQCGKSEAEVAYALRAVVTRPLMLMYRASKRGEEGMHELAEYYRENCRPIRNWCTEVSTADGEVDTNSPWRVRGSFLTIENGRVLVAMMEGQKNVPEMKEPGVAMIPGKIVTRCQMDMTYLREEMGADMNVLTDWKFKTSKACVAGAEDECEEV